MLFCGLTTLEIIGFVALCAGMWVVAAVVYGYAFSEPGVPPSKRDLDQLEQARKLGQSWRRGAGR